MAHAMRLVIIAWRQAVDDDDYDENGPGPPGAATRP
jgi:hypothetical protein